MRRLLRETAIYALGAALSPLAGVVLIPLYTRAMPPEGYGLMAVLGVTGSILGFLGFLGLGPALVRYWTRRAEDPRLIYTALALVLASSGAVGGAVAALSAPLAHLLTPQDARPYLFQLLGLTLAVQGPITVLLAALRAQRRAVPFVLANFVSFSLRISLNYLLVGWLARGVEGVFEAGLLGAFGTCALLSGLVLPGTRPGFSRKMARELLGFGVALVPGNVSSWVLGLSDRYFVQFLAGMGELGIYSLGYKLGSLFETGVIKPFRLAWPPFIYREADAGKDAPRTIARTTLYYTFFGVWAVLVLGLLAEPTLGLLATRSYLAAHRIVPIIAASYFIYGYIWTFGVGLHIARRPAPISWALGIAALANLGLNWVLVPRLGGAGAALATAISFATVILIVYPVSQKEYKVKYNFKLIFGILIWGGLLYWLGSLAPAWPRLALLAAYPLPWLVVKRRALFGIQRAYILARRTDPGLRVSSPGSFSVRQAKALSELMPFIRSERKALEFQRRLQEGNRAYVAFWDGRPAHITWVSLAPKREKHTGYVFNRENWAYIYDSRTLPEMRGRGTYGLLLAYLAKELAGEGVRGLEAVVFKDNEPSLRSFLRAGFRVVGEITAVRLGPFRLKRIKRCGLRE